MYRQSNPMEPYAITIAVILFAWVVAVLIAGGIN